MAEETKQPEQETPPTAKTYTEEQYKALEAKITSRKKL